MASISPELARLDQRVQQAQRDLEVAADAWLVQKMLVDRESAKLGELEAARRAAKVAFAEAGEAVLEQLHREAGS